MTRPHQDEESLPTDEPGLVACMAALDKDMAELQAHIKQLMADENPGRGIFHASAIHEAKQRYMAMRYKHDFCAARLSRLRSASV